jgi:hypothetical protein
VCKIKVFIGGIMDPVSLAAVAMSIQQSSLQQNLAVSMLKQNAQADQSLAQMIQSVAGGRGQTLNISV